MPAFRVAFLNTCTGPGVQVLYSLHHNSASLHYNTDTPATLVIFQWRPIVYIQLFLVNQRQRVLNWNLTNNNRGSLNFTMTSVADIPINQHLGMRYDARTGSLSLPDVDATRNHFGQVSFCAQFTLAEAASAQYLFDRLGMNLEADIPTLRNSTSRFHKPTNGVSVCNLVSLEHDKEAFQALLSDKGKILTKVKVEVLSEEGVKALTGEFQWLVLRKP